LNIALSFTGYVKVVKTSQYFSRFQVRLALQQKQRPGNEAALCCSCEFLAAQTLARFGTAGMLSRNGWDGGGS
jgi:hypothetical protein